MLISVDELVVLSHHILHFVCERLHFVIMNYNEHVGEKIRTMRLNEHVFLRIWHVDIVSVVSGL